MKLSTIAAAVLAGSLAMPALAQDKPAAEAPKAQAKSKGTPHSHLQEKTGIKPSDPAAHPAKPVDKSKHSHPKEK